MLVLSGLPTLFPKLVEARTYSERMFRVVFLQSLDRNASEDAIRRPIEAAACPLQLDDDAVSTIVTMSGGYPYFIQFICREVYEACSHVNQMLVALASQGLVYKNRHGRYSFAVPLLGRFVRRQAHTA
ncbi:MAG: hypothetical protein OXC12_08690 [Spirochaetaceae bacterium]|nr:hypothetical protein [Spirochaetaceae bacterium]